MSAKTPEPSRHATYVPYDGGGHSTVTVTVPRGTSALEFITVQAAEKHHTLVQCGSLYQEYEGATDTASPLGTWWLH